MKSSNKYLFIIFFLLVALFNTSVYATNILTVQDPDIWGTKPGFIDKSTLVVEPRGGYVEESLYLTYSDHGQFTPNSKLEIVHRFELPQGAVINDLWLWIGDSVMQAVMKDTWTARHIYDSIVVFKRDPAFLSKDGNQYELHVYPLYSGQTRRIKINFIVPTKWFGNTATAELPLKLLNSNNAQIKPLEIFFKESQNIWGNPKLLEVPNAEFSNYVDTLGYEYKLYELSNTADLASLNLQFEPVFTDGYYAQCIMNKDNLSYFQVNITPGSFFNLTPDTSAKKYLIGLDLSGNNYGNLDSLISNLEITLKSAIRPIDYFKLIVDGKGRLIRPLSNWTEGTPTAIDSVFNIFLNTDLADSLINSNLPTTIYCDKDASNGWQFPGIQQFSIIKNFSNIMEAESDFSQAQIIAAYRYGFEDQLSYAQLNELLPPLDDFFNRGGRLLTYFDYNRDAGEKLASHFINGLHTLDVTHGPVKLYRNLNGNIGSSFPTSITHESSYYLAYDDSAVKVELMDDQGRPAVISKKIKNGLLVVSGIWELNDDGAMKKMLDIPLLGLNKPSKYFQLPELLDTIKTEYNSEKFDKVLLFSNSDSLFQTYDADYFLDSYLKSFGTKRPIFNTINILNPSLTIPASTVVNNVDYYGSGYLEKLLSDSTMGLHFETAVNDWNYIAAELSPTSLPSYSSFTLKCTDDTLISKIVDLRNINQVKNDPNRPIFFIGSSTANEKLDLEISAQYFNESEAKFKNISLQVNHDTVAAKNDIIPAMIGNEKLKDLFATSSFDTTAIVNLAMKYHLLCDYTALIALEPNDTLHFMQNPNDEGSYTTSVKTNKDNKADSLMIEIFPNPFNIQATIEVNVSSPSVVRIAIYNIMGQLIKVIQNSELISGRKYYIWNAENSHNQTVGSGIYFVNAVIRNNITGGVTVKNKKMILLK